MHLQPSSVPSNPSSSAVTFDLVTFLDVDAGDGDYFQAKTPGSAGTDPIADTWSGMIMFPCNSPGK